MKKLDDRIFFSTTQNAVNSWTGYGGYYQQLFKIELFGFMLVIWRKR